MRTKYRNGRLSRRTYPKGCNDANLKRGPYSLGSLGEYHLHSRLPSLTGGKVRAIMFNVLRHDRKSIMDDGNIDGRLCGTRFSTLRRELPKDDVWAVRKPSNVNMLACRVDEI